MPDVSFGAVSLPTGREILHVLPQDFDRRRALHQHGTQIPDQGREDVAATPVERIGAAHRVGFLSQ